MKKLVLFFISTALWNTLSAQNPKVDSLLTQLTKAKEDTSKVNILNRVSYQFKYSNTDTALHFANRALALATKVNYEKGIADSKISIGALYDGLGKNDDGAQLANDALIIYNKLISSAPESARQKLLLGLGNAYIVLGQNKIGQGNYPDGLKYTLLAIKAWEVYGEKRSISNAKWNIAIIYFTQQNFPDALKYLSDCLKICEQLEDTSAIAGCYSAIGSVYFEMGNNDEASKNYSSALSLAQKVRDNFTIAETYINLGVLMAKKENYDEALEYDFKALSMHEEIGNKTQTPFIYNNIGLVFIKKKKYKDA